MSTFHIQPSQEALAMLALTLGLAAYGRREEHTTSAAPELTTDQAAARVMPLLLGDEARKFHGLRCLRERAGAGQAT